MFSKRSFCAIAFAAYAIPASAADLPARSAPAVFAPPEPIGSWSGFYVGGNVGYGSGHGTTSFIPLPDAASFRALRPTSLDPKPNGVIGGGQVGFNVQFGRLIVGGEADYQASDVRGQTGQSPVIGNGGAANAVGTDILAGQRLDWFGTARLRVGTTFIDPRLMIYATGGVAYGRERFSSFTNFGPQGGPQYIARYGGNKVGYAAGAGAEYAIGRNASVKIEYLHTDLGSYNAVASPNLPIPFQIASHSRFALETVRVGMNIRFGSPLAPVVARY